MLRILLPLILVVSAAIGTGEVIHGCVHKDNGLLRVVIAATNCTEEETAIEWGVIGMMGPQGEKGEPGAPGISDLGCSTSQIIQWDAAQAMWVCSDALAQLQADVAASQADVTALQALLTNVSRVDNTLVISGANLQIVNGAGSTENTNGLGNLIIGYNEERSTNSGYGFTERTGSHVLVVGARNNYTSYGGFVVGEHNDIRAPYASVSGGSGNTAAGEFSSISGGRGNNAEGAYSWIGDGLERTASGFPD
jgi:hypothetical protein